MGIKEALLGVAIGDANGLGVEFKSREWMKENVNFTRYINTRTGKHGQHIEPGFYSDDTEHTIGVTRAILSPQPFSEALLLEKFKDEYFTDKKNKGYPRQGHGSIKKYYEGQKTIEEVRDQQRNRDDPGNAPPMRAVPIGFVPNNLINDYAIINANATHPHPKARAASILVARATHYMVVEKGHPENVILYCTQYIDDEETKEVLSQVNKLGPPNTLTEEDYEMLCGPQPLPYPPQKDMVIYGLPCASMRTAATALYYIKHTKDAYEGLQHSINIGGDVDSLAAIVTGVQAGRYGLESLPSFMLEQVEGRKRIEQLAQELENKQF